MSSNVSVFSFDKVSVLMNAVPITGFFEGDDVVKVIRNADEINYIIGATGDALVSVQTNESAIVELKLMPSSPSNTVLELLARRFKTGLRVNPVPLVITDFQTSAVHIGNQAIILSRPKDVQYGVNATVRTWQILVTCLEDGTIGQI